ncbi:MAG: hypothetical protein AB8F74_17980 [Saprospiraceae bacterium]
MKYIQRISLIMLLIIGINIQKSEGQNLEKFIDFIDLYYEDGAKSFLKTIYENINYPKEARLNCGIGHLHVRLTINPKNGIDDITFLNPFGFGVEEDVQKTLRITETGWNGAGEKREINFTIAYQLGDQPEIKGEINIMAVGSNDQSSLSGCKESKTLMKKLKKGIAKGKFKKVSKYWTELIRRGYHNEEFLAIQKKYGDKFSN